MALLFFKNLPLLKVVSLLSIVFGCVVNFLFIKMLKINNAGFLIFLTTWLALPYIACVIWFIYEKKIVLISSISAFFVSLFFWVDVVLIHPDPQGGVGVLLIPFFQLFAVILLLFFKYIMMLYKGNR